MPITAAVAEEGLRYFAIFDVADQNAKGSGKEPKEPVLRPQVDSTNCFRTDGQLTRPGSR
jgi:hypothetical protein